MVREVRFELTTSCSQSRRATGLRYTLTVDDILADFGGDCRDVVAAAGAQKVYALNSAFNPAFP
jgi:hypothetical protein